MIRFSTIRNGFRYLRKHGTLATWNKIQKKIQYSIKYKKLQAQSYSIKELKRQQGVKFDRASKISLVVPLYNTPVRYLHAMIKSVKKQTYMNWELCMADGSDKKHKRVEKICRQYAKSDQRIKYQKLEHNLGISGNSNVCLKIASGDYIGMLDHDDVLHPAALYEVMKVICGQDADFIYTDEAVFNSPNTFHIRSRHFKPDFAPDNLLANNYICHFTVFSSELLNKTDGFRNGYDGAQDHELFLRLTKEAKKIVHIPKILYFWRGHKKSVALNMDAKNYAALSGVRAVSEFLEQEGTKADVINIPDTFIYRIRYELTTLFKVSILIPNFESRGSIVKCLDSLYKKTSYRNFEIIIIQADCSSEDFSDYYKSMQEKWCNIKIVTWNGMLNYSAMMNYGVSFATGECLVFLNNNTAVITEGWIQEMLMYAQRRDVGAVGAKMYYPDDTVQHGGIVMGLDGVAAGYIHRLLKREHTGYAGRLLYAQNFSAVSGACLMIRREVWNKIGGFEEEFEAFFYDVDLCLRLRKSGYLIVWTPFAELYLYEAKNMDIDTKPESTVSMEKDRRLFCARWSDRIIEGDPYYNPNLPLRAEDFFSNM